MTAYERLAQKYVLEASLTELSFQREALQASIPEMKAKKREAEVARLEAQGALRRLWNRLSGKGEEEQENLERAVREAAAALEATQRDLRRAEENMASAEREFAELGEKQELMAQLTPEERNHFRHLEASLAAEKALHFLRKCSKELAEAQYYARNPMMAAGDGFRENTHKANAGALADQCRAELLRIRENGIDFDIHPYLENPMGYIVTARRYGDQDRMNSAQAGIRETEAALKELLLQLAE